MASQMRHATRQLLERRVEAIESPAPDEAMRERVRRAIENAGPLRAVRLHGEWREEDERWSYEAVFAPAPRNAIVLQGLSLALAMLLIGSAWVLAFASGAKALRFLLPFFTLLGMVALPLVVHALASQRGAEESRVTRSIRAALEGTKESFPPQQRWADED